MNLLNPCCEGREQLRKEEKSLKRWPRYIERRVEKEDVAIRRFDNRTSGWKEQAVSINQCQTCELKRTFGEKVEAQGEWRQSRIDMDTNVVQLGSCRRLVCKLSANVGFVERVVADDFGTEVEEMSGRWKQVYQ